MKKIEDYQKQMNLCYKNYDAFKKKSKDICYIPENAESLEDAFTYSDLKNEVVVWLKNNPDYLKQNNTNIEDTLNCMFECLSWEFPSTFLGRQKSVESKIKLYYVGTLEDGTIRLQSQLNVGKDSADFIIKDGLLKVWGAGNGGIGFHETNIPHEIIYFKKEMQTQIL